MTRQLKLITYALAHIGIDAETKRIESNWKRNKRRYTWNWENEIGHQKPIDDNNNDEDYGEDDDDDDEDYEEDDKADDNDPKNRS